MPHSTICLSFDFDAMLVWFGYKTVTPAMRYRGKYGARVGGPRRLELLNRYNLPATFGGKITAAWACCPKHRLAQAPAAANFPLSS